MRSMTAGEMGADDDLRKPSHPLRAVLVALAVIGAGVGIWGYTRSVAQRDQAQLGPFDAFRVAYAEKCNVPSYAGPAARLIRDDYLTSAPIRDEVARQLAALNQGASCQEVWTKLKAVDFTVPAPGSGG